VEQIFLFLLAYNSQPFKIMVPIMFLRARLKSAYNLAMSSASLMFAGTIELTNIIYFSASGHDYFFMNSSPTTLKRNPDVDIIMKNGNGDIIIERSLVVMELSMSFTIKNFCIFQSKLIGNLIKLG
jgi:hypothetical protein